MKTTVYIASPYTKGDVALNVKRQLDCYDELMTYGFAPFAPLYSHFQHMAHPRPYQDWIEIDKIWVLKCDCVLRLDGESLGADGEVALAKENHIPVFYNKYDMIEYYQNTNKKISNKSSTNSYVLVNGSDVLFYYTGYFNSLHENVIMCPWKPVISPNYNDAMKLQFKDEAEKICAELNRVQPNIHYRVEEHMYV